MLNLQTFLDRTTMYRVILYSLSLLSIQAFIFSLLGLLSHSFSSLVSSFVLIFVTTLATHFLFKAIYKAPANIESTYISAFILFLILAPLTSSIDVLWTLVTSFLTIAGKYVVAYAYRHIFNPVAFGLVVAGLLGSTSSLWWVGGMYFVPFTLVALCAITYKLKHNPLIYSYLAASGTTTLAYAWVQKMNMIEALMTHAFSYPLLFLGAFMLTEPLTTPPTKKTQGVYGALVGVLSSFPFAFHPFYSTPELALLLGNIYSYIVSSKRRFFLTLKEKKYIAKDTYEFIFSSSHKVSYIPGQYMEWTLPHTKSDTRGIRRYFTIASSPQEDVVRLGVKRFEKGSSFKNSLFNLTEGKGLLATSVMGDFVLPQDTTKRCVGIAGGIGITPFISMLRTALLTKEKRDLTLFYANRKREDVAYEDVLSEAHTTCGIKIVYVFSEEETGDKGMVYEKGFITKEMLETYCNELHETIFYISGPPKMVETYASLLRNMGVRAGDIVTDFFPGFS